jgi:hypothetical protein
MRVVIKPLALSLSKGDKLRTRVYLTPLHPELVEG